MNIPTMVLFGDYVDQAPRWAPRLKQCREYAEAMKKAGGKTEVLVKRVLRLLLAGFAPESILCLTYTKTAAAEMQNRLLRELAEWATIGAECLGKKLADLTRSEPDAETLRLARRLFARTLRR